MHLERLSTTCLSVNFRNHFSVVHLSIFVWVPHGCFANTDFLLDLRYGVVRLCCVRGEGIHNSKKLFILQWQCIIHYSGWLPFHLSVMVSMPYLFFYNFSLCRSSWGSVSIYQHVRYKPDFSYRKLYMMLDEATLTFNADPFVVSIALALRSS